MHKLEDTVLKQEKVIQKMEEVLKKFQLKEKQEKLAAKKAEKDTEKNEPANEDVLASLTKQNNRLHLDLQRIKDRKPSIYSRATTSEERQRVGERKTRVD